MIVNLSTITALKTEFRALFNKGFASVQPAYSRFSMIAPSSGRTAEYHFPIFSGLQEWLGDREIANLVKKGFAITNKHFERTYAVNVDDIEDDNLGGYASMFSGLGELAAQHPDGLVATLLLDAFAGASYTAYDGLAMCNASHVLNGRTISNTGVAALANTSLATARATLYSMYGDDKAIIFAPSKFYLVVPPQLEKTGKDLVVADTVSTGGTNVQRGEAELVVLPQLASQPAYWFLVANFAGVSPVVVQIRKRPEFTAMDQQNDEGRFMNNELRYGVDYRGNVGWGPWQLIYGSTGAGA